MADMQDPFNLGVVPTAAGPDATAPGEVDFRKVEQMFPAARRIAQDENVVQPLSARERAARARAYALAQARGQPVPPEALAALDMQPAPSTPSMREPLLSAPSDLTPASPDLGTPVLEPAVRPPTPTSLVDRIITKAAEIRNRDETDVQRNAENLKSIAAMALEPGPAAEVLRYADVFPDWTPDFIAGHLPEVRKLARAAGTDWESIVRRHPVFARVVGDPRYASMAVDDSATLQGLEWALTGKWEALPETKDQTWLGYTAPISNYHLKLVTAPAWAAALRDAWTNDMRAMAWQGQRYLGITPNLPEINPDTGLPYTFEKSKGNQLRINELRGLTARGPREMSPEEAKARIDYEEFLRDHSTGRMDYIGDTGGGSFGAAKRAIANSFLLPMKMSPMIVGTIASGGAGELALGSRFLGMSLFNTAFSTPGLFDELSQVKNDQGQKMPEGVARLATTVAAPLLGMVNSWALGPTFAGYAKTAIEKAGVDVIKRTLTEQTLLRTFGEFGARAGAHILEGAAGFALQNGITAASEQLAGAWALGMEIQPQVVTAAMWEGFKQGLIDMPVMAAFGGGRDLLRNMGMMRRASEAKLKWEVMADAEAAAKHPEVVKEMHAQTRAQPGSATHAYVDMMAFQDAAVKAGLDPKEVMAAVMNDGGVLYEEAVREHKADLVIPLDKARALLGDKRFSEFMQTEGRFNPNDLSFARMSREAARWMKLAQDVSALPVEQMTPEQRAIYDDMVARTKEGAKVTGGRAQAVADAAARYVLRIVTGFHEQTGKQDSLQTWYDRTYGKVGIWAAERTKSVGKGPVANLQIPDAAVAALHPEGVAHLVGMRESVRGVRLGKSSAPHLDDVILTFENATPFTILHELTHAYVGVLNRLIASTEHGATFKPVGDELASALGAGKVWEDLGKGYTKQRAEQFAHALEQYLMEGKSPSIALAPVFARFMQFGSEIIKGGWAIGDKNFQQRFGTTDVALTPELRTFFDRMLASVDEIKAAKEFLKAGLPFVLATKNMTDEQKKEYADLMSGQDFSAQSLLLKMIVEATRRENHTFLKGELARLKLQVKAEADTDPFFVAGRFFHGKGGLSPAAEALLRGPDGKPLRFSADELIARFGKEEGQKIIDQMKEHWGPSSVGPAGKNTVDAEQLAATLGFTSGKGGAVGEMRDALALGLPEKEHIEAEALRRLRQRYVTDLIDNPEQLRNAALDSVMNERVAKKIIMEMNDLARDLDPDRASRTRSITPEKLRDLTDRLIRIKTMRDIRPESYANAVAAATLKSRELAKAGDLAGAWDASEGALLNMYMYKAAREWSQAIEKAQERLLERATSDSWRAKLGLADPETHSIINLHDSILKAVQIYPMKEGEVPLGPKVVDDFLAFANDHGMETSVDGWDQGLVRELLAGSKKWDDLTPDDASSVYNAIVNIQTVAKAMNELRIGDKTMQLDMAASEIKWDLEKLPFQGKAPRDMELVSVFRELGLKIQSVVANADDFHTLMTIMGQGAKKFMYDSYVTQKYKKFEIEQRVMEVMKEGFEGMSKESRDSFHKEIPGIATELPIPEGVNLTDHATLGHLVMIAFQMGNEHNRGALLRGMGWNVDQVHEAFEKYLNPEIMDFVQKVWDLHDNYLWPLIEAKEIRKKGLPPDKVIATPLTLTFNGVEHTYRGGYFHAKYDTRAGAKPMELAAERTGEKPVRMKPATSKTYTYGRSPNYADVMDLNWGVLPSHLSEVVHDLAFDEWVTSMNKIIFNKKFDMPATLYQRLGEEGAKQPRAFLEAVARNGDDTIASQMARTFGILEAGRSRVIMGNLGYSVPVAAADLLNPIAIALFGKVKMADLGAVMAAMPFNFRQMYQTAMSKSVELQIRKAHADPMLREQVLVAMRGGQAAWKVPLRAIQRNAFVFLNMVDQLTSTAVWLAKYREVLREHPGGDEKFAIKEADEAVQSSMPSHTLNEMSSFIRDHRTMGSLLIFQGYWNKLFQMTHLKAHEAMMAWHDPDVSASKAMGLTAVNAIRVAAALGVTSVLGDYVMGHGKEDNETWGQWWGRKYTVAPFGLVPFASNLAEPLADLAWTGKIKPMSIRSAPFLASIQMITDNIGRLASDRREGDQKVWDAIELALFTARLPYRQPRRTGEYLTNLAEGHTDAPDPFAFTSGMLYGERRKQAANPASDISSAIQGR